MLYKENQDLKAKMQNLRNYYDREKLISQNKKAMRNFLSRSHKRKIRYQRSYESSGNEETDNEEKYYVNSKKKKPRKKYYEIDGNYNDVDGDIDDYADDEEFSENDNDNNDNDEKHNKNKNKKKVIQKQKQKLKTQFY